MPKVSLPQLALGFLLSLSTTAFFGQVVSTVVNFSGTNGASPFFVTLTQGRDAKLYGTTYSGGANDLGAVVRINLSNSSSAVLHSFAGTDGSYPGGGVTLATDGNYYGTTVYGGSASVGVLYKITASGTYTVLHEFAGSSDGSYPYGPPIEASDGNLYGKPAACRDPMHPLFISSHAVAPTAWFIRLAKLPAETLCMA